MSEHPETRTARVDGIDRAALTPLVRNALNRKTVEGITWDCEQLHGGIGYKTAVYRFYGHCRDRDQKVSWSLILKILFPGEDNIHLDAWNFYKREAEAYQSTLLDNLPGGLTAPRCFGVHDQPDGTCWVWLEDVSDEVDSQWPLERFGVAARHAGQFNGAFLLEQSLPGWPWLSSDWLRGYIALSIPAIPRIRSSLDHPMVRRGWPGDHIEKLFRLWEDRTLFLDALDRLPQTLCHLDLFGRNLFARKTAEGADQTVAIDWAFVGKGAIGAELVPLVLASLAMYEVDLSQAQALEDVVFEGYLEGLSDAGWQGDPRLARLGYAASSLRFRCGELNRTIELMLNDHMHPSAEQSYGHSIEEIEDHWAQVAGMCDRLTDEARALMDILD